jgi:ABC-type transport system involved in multi-copper enzyme maturation permease subunit
MNGILAIGRASVTEHFRRKLIVFFLAMLAVVTAGLIYLNVNDELASTVTNAAIGLATAASLGLLPFLATLAAVAVSMNNIGRPFSDGEAALILYRPIGRWQYVLGRLAGSVAVIFGLCAVSGVLMQLVGLMEEGEPGLALWGHWASTALNLTVLASITTLASSLVNAPVLAALISYFLYSISGLVEALYLLVSNARVGGAGAALITAAWYLTPKRLVSPLVIEQIQAVGPAASLPGSTVLSSTGRTVWAIAYLAIMVLLTFVVVERKDLQG